ncbi:MAG TPA: DUF6766 family protein [Terriglobales bacterium]|nr:DUF6766 family protein [Terriglobales bacterium]
MRNFLRDNGLSLVLVFFFIAFWAAQSAVGTYKYNNDQQQHGRAPVTYAEYLRSGAFWEATAENWESEFLQMFAYVLLTGFLIQKGSAESKSPDSEEETTTPEELQPGLVRRGGWALKFYEHSLSLTFLALFLISFVVHGIGGVREYNQEQAEHGQPGVSLLGYFVTAQFWFESFQNWQSEFLAVLAMVVLSIWLREKDSPESKRVDAPHSEPGA